MLELNENACSLAAEMVMKNYNFQGDYSFFNAKRTMAVADLPPKTPIRPQQKKERVRRRMHSNFCRIHSFFAEYTPRRTRFYFLCDFAFGVNGMPTFVKKNVFGPPYTLF